MCKSPNLVLLLRLLLLLKLPFVNPSPLIPGEKIHPPTNKSTALNGFIILVDAEEVTAAVAKASVAAESTAVVAAIAVVGVSTVAVAVVVNTEEMGTATVGGRLPLLLL